MMTNVLIKKSKLISMLLVLILVCSLFPTTVLAEEPELSKVLLVQDQDPLRYRTHKIVLQHIIDAGDLDSYDVANAEELLSLNLADYDVIYVVNKQFPDFVNAMNQEAQQDHLKDYADSGGVIIYGMAHIHFTFPSYLLPRDVVASTGATKRIEIVDYSHPIVTGELSANPPYTYYPPLTNDAPYTGQWIISKQFSNLPSDVNVIINNKSENPAVTPVPCIAEYPYGDGHIIVSGIDWEMFYGSPGADTVPRRAFDDLFLYALTLAKGDTEAPTVEISAVNYDTSTYNEGEWTNQEVAVRFEATDANLSSFMVDGIERYAGNPSVAIIDVVSEGSTTIPYTAVDSNSNETSGEFTVTIDTTKPWIDIETVLYYNGNNIDLGYISTGYNKNVEYTYLDNLSGYVDTGELLKTGETINIPTGVAGFDKQASLSIDDRADNESIIVFDYNVVSMNDLISMLEPMESNRSFKKNRTVPIKLQILDELGDPMQMHTEDLTFELELLKGTEVIEVIRTNKVSDDLSQAEFTLSEDGLTYHYNLKTKGLQSGEYTLNIYIVDKVGTLEGLVGTVIFIIE